MDKKEIKENLKKMIVQRLELKIKPEDIKDDLPLFDQDDGREGLGLDSVEALEIVVGIEQIFNVTVEEGEYKDEFYSINTLADFIEKLLKNNKGL